MTESTNAAIVRKWFDLAHSDDRWSLADDDLMMSAPFAPPGRPKVMSGLSKRRKTSDAVRESFKSFSWVDLEIFQTEQSDIVFVTTKSRAVTQWDTVYTNEYIFKIKLRDGKLLQISEFFNPLLIVAALEEMKAHGAAIGR
jgi:ketosteroid isomerase-like protein